MTEARRDCPWPSSDMDWHISQLSKCFTSLEYEPSYCSRRRRSSSSPCGLLRSHAESFSCLVRKSSNAALERSKRHSYSSQIAVLNENIVSIQPPLRPSLEQSRTIQNSHIGVARIGNAPQLEAASEFWRIKMPAGQAKGVAIQLAV